MNLTGSKRYDLAVQAIKKWGKEPGRSIDHGQKITDLEFLGLTNNGVWYFCRLSESGSSKEIISGKSATVSKIETSYYGFGRTLAVAIERALARAEGKSA